MVPNRQGSAAFEILKIIDSPLVENETDLKAFLPELYDDVQHMTSNLLHSEFSIDSEIQA